MDIVRNILELAELDIDTRRELGLPPRRLQFHGDLKERLDAFCNRRTTYWLIGQGNMFVFLDFFKGPRLPTGARRTWICTHEYMFFRATNDVRVRILKGEAVDPHPGYEWAGNDQVYQFRSAVCYDAHTGESCTLPV